MLLQQSVLRVSALPLTQLATILHSAFLRRFVGLDNQCTEQGPLLFDINATGSQAKPAARVDVVYKLSTLSKLSTFASPKRTYLMLVPCSLFVLHSASVTLLLSHKRSGEVRVCVRVIPEMLAQAVIARVCSFFLGMLIDG